MEGGDFLEWRPREFNRIADNIANLVMDHKRGFSYRNDRLLEAIRPGNANILVFSDGGSRPSEAVASGGWVAFVLGGHWGEQEDVAHLLASEGILIKTAVSAFQAEITAAASALEFIRSLSEPVGVQGCMIRSTLVGG